MSVYVRRYYRKLQKTRDHIFKIFLKAVGCCGRIFITSLMTFCCWLVRLFSHSSPIPHPLHVAGTRGLDIRIQGNSCVCHSLTYPRDFSGSVTNQQVAYKLESCLLCKFQTINSPNFEFYFYTTRLFLLLYNVLKLCIVCRSCSVQNLTFWDEIQMPYFKDASTSPQKAHLILNYTLQYCDLHTTVTPSTAVSLIISAGSHLAFTLITSSSSWHSTSWIGASETGHLLGIFLHIAMYGPGSSLDRTWHFVDSPAAVFKCQLDNFSTESSFLVGLL